MAERLISPPFDTINGLPVTSESPRPRDGGFSVTMTEPYDGLPPDDMWLVPKEDSRSSIETPLDERGLVDTEALITACKSLISRSYDWPKAPSSHHLYWTDEMYQKHAEANPGSIAVAFRGLPINIGRVPRRFENVIHYTTVPAPVPDEYVMRMRTESWRVAHSLFTNVRNAVSLERQAKRRALTVARNPDLLRPEFNGEDVIGQQIIAELFSRHFRGINQHLEAQYSLPEEYRLFDPGHKPEDIATQLGRIVGKRFVPMVGKVLAA